MFKLTAKIEIKGTGKKWEFDKVAEVEITRDTDTLTDTCVLKLPKKVRWQNEERIPIKRGDEVTVWLGYDDELELAFRGFVTTIGLKPRSKFIAKIICSNSSRKRRKTLL